ncbi:MULTISPECIES: MarC family protein [unclassified Wenzhouxiangella]|uniref:MarC family protein n=1 Tax=unclassified Wenzhouxiangella TaxID=2613841 RepID=UPI000E32D2AC|nr:MULTISPECIES: MarC family protein [unclassified Wenzhouxiangella]RFF28007.1 MarC family protein [Wenzhouxiangella sp. 15181]RFP68594.1 MarC family protein [Wenzhouxiangella sp. 15190]
MASIIEYFLIAIVGMFVIVNPLTTAFAFASLTADSDDEEQEAIARRAVIASTAMLFVFALMGSLIFQLFGITLAAFRIAGGMILFGIAMNMLNKSEAPDHAKSEARPSRALLAQDVAIVPLSIPFISGPGAIATAMILTSEAPGFWYSIVVLFAIAVTTVSCYFTMVYSNVVIRWLGNSGRRILTKVFGLILAVIAVQFVLNGVGEAVTNYLAGLEGAAGAG